MLAHLIKLYRLEHGITLRDFAKQVGIGYLALRRFEHGQQVEKKTTLRIIVWLLNEEVK